MLAVKSIFLGLKNANNRNFPHNLVINQKYVYIMYQM